MQKFFYLLLIIALTACQNTADPSGTSDESIPSDESTTNNTQEATSAFAVQDSASFDPTQLRYTGQVISQHVWQDQSGENIALLTQNDTSLYAYHYIKNGSAARRLHTLDAPIGNCEFDLFLEFVTEETTVTDLDNDQVGEITFAYKKACISDVSPLDLVVVTWEGYESYALSGYTSVRVDEAEMAP
ncbi:MAG: hypothetical protein AAGJ82_15400, partial [Bacteroidota bacterium]